MDDPQSTEEAQSWDAPTTTPTGNADVDAGNQEVPEQQLLGEEYQQATTDPQAQRQAQTAQRAAYKVQGEDLARRGIGYYTDLQTGAPKQLTDDAGSAITNFDKTTAIGYDSSGNPQKLSYDAQSGQPKLTNPYAAAQPFTDPKTGNIYKAPDNLAWQYQGQDPKIAQQLQQQKEDKLNNQTVTALAAPVALAKQNLTAAQQIAQDSAGQTSTKLQGLGVPMVGADGQPLDLSQADPQALKNSVETSFNSEYASSAANEKPLWGDGLTQSAQALRTDIDRRRQQALQAVDDHVGKLNDVATASGQYDQARAPVVAIQAAKIDALNQQRVLAGLPAVPVPAEMRRIASLAGPPAIPGLDHAGQPLGASQPAPYNSQAAIPNLPQSGQGPQQQEQSATSAQPAANTAAPQGPKAEGVLGSLLRPTLTGIVPAAGAAVGGIGGGALAGLAGLETGPGAIATAIAGDIAGGAAGGALAQKAQNAVMGGEWTKQNQAQMAANAKEHPIASAVGNALPMVLSLLGAGGSKAITGTVNEAGQIIPGAAASIENAVKGFLGRTVEQTEAHPQLMTKAIDMLASGASRLPATLTQGARLGGAQEAENDVTDGRGFANVIPAAIKGAATFGPAAFIPEANGVLTAVLGKGPAMAATIAASNAMYDHYVSGKPFDISEIKNSLGTDVPAFMIQEGIAALLKIPPGKIKTGEDGGPAVEAGEPKLPTPADSTAAPAPEAGPVETTPKETATPVPAEPAPDQRAALEKEVAQHTQDRDTAANEGNGLGQQLSEASRSEAQSRLDALQPAPDEQPNVLSTTRKAPEAKAATPAATSEPAVRGAIPGIEPTEPTQSYRESVEGNTHEPATPEQNASTQALLDSPEAKEVLGKLGKLKGVKSVDEEKGIPFVTQDGKTKINTRALSHALDALDTPEAKHAYVVNGLDEELKHQASLIALKPNEAEAIGKSLTPQERTALEHAYGAKIDDDHTAGHEAIRAFMQGAEGKQTEAFKLFTEKARTDGVFRAAIEKVLNLIKQLAKTPGALSDRLSEGIRKTQAVLDTLDQHNKLEAAIPDLKDEVSPQPKVEPSESVKPKEPTASEKGRTAEATPEATKAEAVEPKLVEGAKVRLGKSPQLHTITEELPPAKGDQPDEKFFSVTNDRTGETQTVESRDITPVKARSEAEKAEAKAATAATEAKLDKRLRDAGMDPSALPDQKSKREALKRYEQKKLGAADPAAEAGANTNREKELAAKLWKEKGTDSPFFKKWFKDSIVRDSDGTPSPVYHGSIAGAIPDDFSKRDISFFTPVEKTANIYAGNGETGKFYISLKNPLEANGPEDILRKLPRDLRARHASDQFSWQVLKDKDLPELYEDSDVIEHLKDAGYDGLILHDDQITGKHGLEPHTSYAVFDADQIKSASSLDSVSSPENGKSNAIQADSKNDYSRASNSGVDKTGAGIDIQGAESRSNDVGGSAEGGAGSLKAGASLVPSNLGASGPNADKLRDAYEAVHSDRVRNRWGFQSVKIADVLDEAKLPIEEGKKLIQDLVKKGEVQLYAGDHSLSSERERAAAIEHPGQQSPDTLMHFNEREPLGAANPNDDKSKAGEPESAEAKEPSKSPPLTPSSEGASAEDNGEPAQGKTPAERLIRQADAHDIPYSLETLKGLIRGDSKSLDKMRTMLRDKGQEPLGASSPTSPESLKERITRYTPGLEIGKNIVNGIKSLMLPGAIDAEHLHAAETMGARLGEKNRRGEQAAHNLGKESFAFEKMGVGNDTMKTEENPGMKFMSAASKGRPMGEKLDAVKAKLDDEWKKRSDLMEEAGVPLQKFRESYFPGMWTRDSRIAMDTAFKEAQSRGEIPEDFDINNAPADLKATIRARVEELLKGPTPSGEPKSDVAQYFSRKPLEGSASFRKAKVFDDVGTGAEFGLKPVDMNPIKVAQAKMEEMDRFIMAHQTFGDFEKQGNLINIGNEGKPMKASEAKNFNRNDWVKIDDKYGTIWRKGENGEMIKQGERWAKKPAARIINNYLSSSLYNSPYFGDAYKAWMGAANALNQSQLGVGSMFHAGFTAMESQVSAAANVIKDVFGVMRGNRSVGDLGKTLGKLPIAVPENLLTGDKVMNAWRDPNGTADPKVRQIARAVELAGGGFKMEKGLQTDQTQKMIRDWYGDHQIRAAVRSPVAAIEMMAKPIMDWLVPRQKAGVFAHMAGRIIDQNPGKSMEDLTPEFRQAWNRVDSRLGQVGYARLFANNTAKNVIQALVRAPGWSGGTIAELGGAFKDTANFVKEWASTGKLPKDIPDRVAYTMGLIITGAAINGAATYALTGQKPTGTDFVAFRTGKKDEQGNDERFMLPSYLKDLWAYSQHPGQTLVNKAHPLLGMVSSLAKNQDYYGTEIRNPDSNPVAQTGQAAGYVAKQFEPFWIRGEQKEAERRSGTLEKALPLFGVTPAPKEMNLSPAQRLAAQMNAQRAPSLPSTEQQSDRRVARSQATVALRQGDSSVMQKELQQGALRPSDVRSITAKATTDPLVYQVKSLPLEQAERVYAVATPAERAKLLPVMAQKRTRAGVPQRPQFSFK